MHESHDSEDGLVSARVVRVADDTLSPPFARKLWMKLNFKTFVRTEGWRSYQHHLIHYNSQRNHFDSFTARGGSRAVDSRVYL